MKDEDVNVNKKDASKGNDPSGVAPPPAIRDMDEFDTQNAEALKRIWFLGDVHGNFKHIEKALKYSNPQPRRLIFVGDVDIDDAPFREVLRPLKENHPGLGVAFIHGNHDADTYEHWEMLHDCGDAVALHKKVITFDGIRIAGLGGNFMGRVWNPPAEPTFQSKEEAMNRGPYQWRDGQRPNPSLNAAIYPADVVSLAAQRADILVTHEAPSCHPYGYEALDNLARSLRVVRTFHGHHHDDRSDDYAKLRSALRFDAKAVEFCGIKDGLGHVVLRGTIA